MIYCVSFEGCNFVMRLPQKLSLICAIYLNLSVMFVLQTLQEVS